MRYDSSWSEFVLKSQDEPNKNLSEVSVLKVFPVLARNKTEYTERSYKDPLR